MKGLDVVAVLIAMLVPFFAFKSHDLTSYFYWFAVTFAYLLFVWARRWEVE